jgi:hypothetical protein
MKHYFFQRFSAAFLAIVDRVAASKFAARLVPPFRPSDTAAGSLPCSSGVGGRSSTSPAVNIDDELGELRGITGALFHFKNCNSASTGKRYLSQR